MNKLRPLKPSMREKTRHIAFEIVTDKSIDFKHADSAILNSIKSLIGDLGTAKASPIVVKNLYKDNKGIIKTERKYVDHIKASLTLINKINDNEVLVKSTKTSGMIKKASEAL